MSHHPNKPTIIAAAIYGLCKQAEREDRRGVVTLAWTDLTNEQRAPFLAAADFLFGQTFGVPIQTVERAKLAAAFEKAKFDGIEGNANDIVSVFVNVGSLML